MNFNVTQPTFKGKNEVLYGLTKAINLSKTIERNNKAYNKHFFASKNIEQKEQTAAMLAYIDMVINDSDFVATVNKKLKTKDINYLKNIAKPETTEHGTIDIKDNLYSNFIDIAKNDKLPKEIKNAIESLFLLLK